MFKSGFSIMERNRGNKKIEERDRKIITTVTVFHQGSTFIMIYYLSGTLQSSLLSSDTLHTCPLRYFQSISLETGTMHHGDLAEKGPVLCVHPEYKPLEAKWITLEQVWSTLVLEYQNFATSREHRFNGTLLHSWASDQFEGRQ